MATTCKLYRHFGPGDELLYVGVSKSAVRRLSEHSSSKWAEDIVRVSVATFQTRAEALEAERHAIMTEHPKFNVMHTKVPPVFSGVPKKIKTGTMTPAERQSLKRARVKAGLIRMEIWVPQEKFAALSELLSDYT